MARFRKRRFQIRRKKGPLPLRHVILISIVFFIFSTILGLWIINRGLKPTLISVAKSQTQQIAALIINRAVLETEVEDIHSVIKVDQESSLMTFDTERIYRKLGETTEIILEYLKAAEKGQLEDIYTSSELGIDLEKTREGEGIVYSIPLGKATNNILLGNVGPNIPVRFHLVGDIEPDIETKFEEAGINNVYVEVSLKLKMNVQVVIPFAAEVTQLEQTVPIALGIIKGDVPQFYNKGGGTNPSIKLPVDE